MRKILFTMIACSIVLIPTLTFGQRSVKKLAKIKPEKVLLTRQDTATYALGVDIIRTLNMKNVNYRPEILAIAVMREYYSNDSIFSDEQIVEYLNFLQEDIETKENSEKNTELMKNKQEGLQFLTENRNKPGVQQTESGLQYKVIRQGTGETANAKSTVRVHYRGTFLNGEVFDSSYDRGESIEFPLDGVIAGWTEGLQLMNPGSKYIFFIPPSLGYGESGVGPIAGGTTLIFEVELISIVR